MIGRTIGQYRIIEKLGEGGMGIVYKATDANLDRTVALKFLSPKLSSSETEKQRFVQEARAASSLNHPNICTIHDIKEHEGQLFIVMEFVEGRELLSEAGKLTEEDALTIASQICDGLAAAHAKDIIHRDIKSSNIILTNDGRAKIMDFGLARRTGGAGLTTVRSTVGTMAYLPPEQARGEPVDRRADVYAVGVVLFEMLTGQRPFDAPYEHALLYKVLNEEAKPVSSIRKDISASTDTIVEKCLRKEPAERYQSVAELREDIEDALSGTVIVSDAEKQNEGSPTVPLPKKWLVPALSLLLLVALITVFSSGDLWDSVTNLFGDGVPDQIHLAVLPIANIGSDPDLQSLCDGLTETMASQLTQLEQFHGGLWVVPATEIRKSDVQSAQEAARVFGVNLVVDGSLQPVGDRFRLLLNLVDAGSLRQIGSMSVDVAAQDLGSLHDASVIRMLELLHLEMHPEMRGALESGGTSVPVAYEFYLRGRGSLLRYESVENIDKAMVAFRQAILADSSFALAYAALAEALWRKYEFSKDTQWITEAEANCERAAAIDPNLAPVKITLGLVYNGTGRPELSIPLFEAALRIDPANTEAYRGLARAYEASGDDALAEQTYKRAVELRPDYWAVYNDLGVFYFRASRYEDAIAAFAHITELTPDNSRGYNNLGGMYYMLERWEDAREMFERSYTIQPTYRTASNLGTLNFVEGRYDEAAEWYEKALTYNTTDHVVTGNLASAYYWSTSDRSKAKALFIRAIELAGKQLEANPSDAETMALIGGYYAMTGDTAQARSFADRSLDAGSTDASILFRAGTTFEQIGDRDRAIEWLGKALSAGYSVSEISNQPELRDLYTDPRFIALTEEPE